MMSAQEGGLTQALADRGLAQGANGVAAQGFSNLYGNKMEQLAASQKDIAQRRVQTAMQLAQARSNQDLGTLQQSGAMIGGLGSLGSNTIQNQIGNNRNAVNDETARNAQGAGLNQNQQQIDQSIKNDAFAQQMASQGPSLGDLLAGLGGSAVGGITGGATGVIGTNLGNKIMPKTPGMT